MGNLSDQILNGDPQTQEPQAPATPPVPQAPDNAPSSTTLSQAILTAGQDPEAKLHYIVGEGSKIPADTSARVLDLQMKTGLPVDLIQRNLDQVSQAAAQKDFNPQQFMATSPVVARWLSQNPVYASVAQHDLGKLSLTEALLKSTSAKYNANWSWSDNVFTDLRKAYLGWKKALTGLQYSTPIEQGLQAQKIGQVVVAYGPDGLPVYAPQSQIKAIEEQGKAAEQAFAKSIAPIQADIASLPVRPATAAVQNATNWHDMYSALKQDPLGVMADIGITTTAQQLPVLALTVATRSPIAASALMGTNSYATEMGSGVIDYLASKGIDTKDPKAIMKALSDDATAQRAVDYAHKSALLMGAVGAISGGVASRELVPSGLIKNAAARELTNALVAQPIAQGTIGSAGSALGGDTSPGQVFSNFAGAFSFAPLESGLFGLRRYGAYKDARNAAFKFKQAMLGSRFVPLDEYLQTMGDAIGGVKQAADTAASMNALDHLARDTKMREAAPAQFEQLVKQVAGEGNVDSVYIPREKWDGYFQSAKMDPAEAAARYTDNPQAYTDAEVTGDVVVPLEKYAARIAGTDVHQGLAQDLRFNPEDMTLREAQDFKDNSPEWVQKFLQETVPETSSLTDVPDSAFNGDLAHSLETVFLSDSHNTSESVPLAARGFTPDEIAALKKAGLADAKGEMSYTQFGKYQSERTARLNRGSTPTEDTSGAVYADALAKLTAAGMDKGSAEQQATLMQSVFRTLGSSTGADPLALYKRYGLTVERQLASGHTLSADQTPSDLKGKIGAFFQRLTGKPSSLWDERGQPILTAGERSEYTVDGKPVKANPDTPEGMAVKILAHPDQYSLDKVLAPYDAAGETDFANQVRQQVKDLQGRVGFNKEFFQGKAPLYNRKIFEQLNEDYKKAVADKNKRKIASILAQAYNIKRTDSSVDRGAGMHNAPDTEGAPMYDLTDNGVYPEDVYSYNGLQYYGTGEDRMDAQAYNLISSVEGHPDRRVRIYRSVEKDSSSGIQPGDWVTIVRSYAKEHGEAHIPGEYKIISKLVRARDIFTNGDSWLEWGYHPQENKAFPILIHKDLETGQPYDLLQRFDRYINARTTSTFLQPVYHGSPHTFDKFSLDAIGTGEGAQAYGWGLYFAGKKEVAHFYKEALSDKLKQKVVVDDKEYENSKDLWPREATTVARARAFAALKAEDGSVEKAISHVQKVSPSNTEAARKVNEQAIKLLEGLKGKNVKVTPKARGNLYQADIPEDKELLDWDKPLSEQPEDVKTKLKKGIEQLTKDGESFWQRDLQALDAATGGNKKHFTGADLYSDIQEALGSHDSKDASLFLNKLGIPGLRYLDNVSRGKGEGTHNYVIWDDSRVSIEAVNDELRQAQEMKQGGPGEEARGKIQFNQERNRFNITLLEKADLTTFLHESGHFYLEVMNDLIKRGEAPDQLKADWQTIRDFVGAKEGEDFTTDQHEQFARAFEAYLGEGKAPSLSLSTAFAHFKEWVLGIYKSLKNLNVNLTDEVRGVFDRLLATDDEIKAAEQMQNYTPTFESAEAAGMSKAQFKSYQDKIAEASAEAQAELAKEAMDEALRARQAWFRKRRADVKAQVTDEINQQPVYRAMYWLQKGELPDGSKPEDVPPLKLSRDALVEAYGEETLKKLPRPFVYTREGGLSPETVAPMFGFANGDELVGALMNAEPRTQAINAETDKRLNAEYGDLLTDGTIAQKALDAVHNDKRLAVMLAEQRALDNLTGRKRSPSTRQVVKASAKRLIGQKRIMDIKPNTYRVAEAKSARDAFEAAKKQDYNAASVAKSREMLNHELYREARAALDAADKTRAFLNSFTKTSRRQRLGKAGADYLEQMDALLNEYEFQKIPLKQLKRRESLAQFLRRHESDVQPVERPRYADDPAAALNASADPQSANLTDLQVEIKTTNWKQLTPDELQGVRDNAELIWHLAKLKDSLLASVRFKNLQDAATIVSESIRGKANRTVKQAIQSELKWNKLKQKTAEYLAQSRRVPTFAAEMDGGEAGGAMWEAYVRPLNEATNHYTGRLHKFGDEFAEIYNKHYTAKEQTQMLKRPQSYDAINTRLTKDAVLAMALNWGNETNRNRLMNGDKWSVEQVHSVLKTLDARDWSFVQSMWDYINTYWGDFAQNHKDLFGIPPVKVEGDIDPILREAMDKYGIELKGGYYPIVFDPQRSTVTSERALAQEGQRFMSPKNRTRAGAAIERVKGNVGIPLRLTVAGVVQAHISDVIHHIAYDKALLDTSRILHHPEVRDAIIEHYGKAVFDRFNRMLIDIKWGTEPAKNSFEQFLNHVRNGASVAGMAFSVTTSLLQPLGLSNSVAAIGADGVMKGLARMGRDATHLQNSAAWAMEQSEFMRYRRMGQSREIGDVLNRLRKRGWRTKMDVAAFWLIANSQFVSCDLPTWYGAYEKAKSAGQDHATAVQIADQMVRDAQGGGDLIDQTEFQRGGPVIKLFTNFMSYVAATYSLEAQRFRTTKLTDPVQVLHFVKDTLLLMAVPAVGQVALDAMRTGLTGGQQQNKTPLDWAEQVAWETGGMFAGPFIGVRDLLAAARGYNDTATPAGLAVFGKTAAFIAQLEQLEADEAFWRSLNAVSGVLFHLPAVQIDRTVRGAYALWTHQTDNPLVLLLGPPPKPHKKK